MYEAIRRVLNALVTDLIEETHARVSRLGATTLAEIRRAPERLAGLSEPMEAARAGLQGVPLREPLQLAGPEQEHARAEEVIVELFARLMADPV